MDEEIRLQVIDSHTGGEPTRVVVPPSRSGWWAECGWDGLDAAGGSLMERKARLGTEFDWLRSACVNEPRGHEAMVGALLCEPSEPNCAAGVIFFNNVGPLNGCVHGTIGVAVTLAHMGRIFAGQHRIDTPHGVLTVEVGDHGRVTVANVPSYRHAKDVPVEVPGWGTVRGDVAWGGNWFFLIDGQGPPVVHRDLDALMGFTWAVRQALEAHGVTGADGMEIDHVEVFGPFPDGEVADSRNFVLCPGRQYDRSPCGTGTSAKLACLHADGKLAAGAVWRQAGILDTVFEGSVLPLDGGQVAPRVSGSAFVTAETDLILRPDDPFRVGIPSVPGCR
jgi:4-hydroxyproline epimerase